MKVVVLAGGLSPERDVSLSSGSLIANALIENGHDVLLLDLYLGQPDISKAKFLNKGSDKRYIYQVPSNEPDLELLKKESDNGDSLIGKVLLKYVKLAMLYYRIARIYW